MAKKKIIEEENLNGEQQGSKSGSGSAGESIIGNSEGQSTGQNDGTSAGESAGNQGRTKRTSTKNGKDRTESKRNLIENIRNKRNQGDSSTPSSTNPNVEIELQGLGGGNNGTDGTLQGANRGTGRPNLELAGIDGQDDGNDGNLDNDNQSSETSGRIKNKQGGVEIKLPPLLPSSKESKKPIDKNIEQEDVLTAKESKDLKPRIVDALTIGFQYMDKGIGITTKNPSAREVFIWQSISKEEIEIIATALLETGQKVKVVAAMTRQVAREYQKLQMGIIFIPRFVMTVQHYIQNGFGLPFGK